MSEQDPDPIIPVDVDNSTHMLLCRIELNQRELIKLLERITNLLDRPL